MAKPIQWERRSYVVTNPNKKPFNICVRGRQRWALDCLLNAGNKGCTPIDTPGPRWSGYVIDLQELGVQIETISQPNDGPFAGKHARYVRRSRVQLVEGDAT